MKITPTEQAGKDGLNKLVELTKGKELKQKTPKEIRTRLICNECSRATHNKEYVKKLICFWCGSDNVGIETDETQQEKNKRIKEEVLKGVFGE